MSIKTDLKTESDFIAFASMNKTEQSTKIASYLKNVVYVTNQKEYYIFDDESKLFISQNAGQYYSYSCDIMNDIIIKPATVIYSKIQCELNCRKSCYCGSQRKKEILFNLINSYDKKDY